jgi:DnaJ-class molecular chaperone
MRVIATEINQDLPMGDLFPLITISRVSVISDFFGGGQRRSGPQTGADLLMRIKISHEQAVFGLNQDIVVMHTVPCPTCNGSGQQNN